MMHRLRVYHVTRFLRILWITKSAFCKYEHHAVPTDWQYCEPLINPLQVLTPLFLAAKPMFIDSPPRYSAESEIVLCRASANSTQLSVEEITQHSSRHSINCVNSTSITGTCPQKRSRKNYSGLMSASEKRNCGKKMDSKRCDEDLA